MKNRFPITQPEYDENGRRVTPRMYRVQGKKRFVMGIAAMLYYKTKCGDKQGNYAATWRLLKECLAESMWMRISENWMRVRLKRMGIGFSSRHPGEMYDFQDEWRVVTLAQEVYKSYGEEDQAEIMVVSHHHKNGAAFEIAKGKCPFCEKPVPAALNAYNKLLKIRRKTM